MLASWAALSVWPCFAGWLLAASTSPECMCSKWCGVSTWGQEEQIVSAQESRVRAHVHAFAMRC
jgi:hypothetical protein